MHTMARKSPLEDPKNAAYAWARYRRIMRMMLALTVGIVAAAFAVIYFSGANVSIHFYIAVALGLGFTMMLTASLMGLIFLSSGTGHDEAVDDSRDPGREDESGR
jgi:hypothetical protein